MFRLLLAAWMLLAPAVFAQSLTATGLDGQPIQSLAPSGTRVVVLVFVASDCPISNRYLPELAQLAAQHETKGVRLWLVYPNPGDTAGVVRRQQAQFDVHLPTALDAAQTLVKLAHIHVTPEAAVFRPNGSGLRELWHGRIDDRYLSFGHERPQAFHHDLEDAIRALLEGRQPQPAGGPAIGCTIIPAQGLSPR
ncbi:redoxin domain-containing protein [Silvibacterium sp.]|uniref:redoxin domain-containing protein n=1 Tax=Silvibacterium sp. TaxID=1964179 RepID=UPI0039E3EAF9